MLMLRLPLTLATAFLTTTTPTTPTPQQDMSFFITSVGAGNGAALGGLEGADKHCATLAEAAGVRGKTWHAYLSQQALDGKSVVNARDRIGKGPWKNAKGVVVATSVDDLHSDSNKLSKENSITEKGMVVNGRGDTPNEHDILTGSRADGTSFAPGPDATCKGWTSSSDGAAIVGHHDRISAMPEAWGKSWNFSHFSAGCSQQALVSTGGSGRLYCFAAN